MAAGAASAALIACGVLIAPAFPQAMTPMRGEVTSYTDVFAVRVHPFNPYRHRIKVTVKVYDQNFRPVRARVVPAEMMLGGGTTRPVIVTVGFGNQPRRRVRICTESIPFPNAQQLIRAQICGKFLATRVR